MCVCNLTRLSLYIHSTFSIIFVLSYLYFYILITFTDDDCLLFRFTFYVFRPCRRRRTVCRSCKTHPGSVIHISDCPTDPSKVMCTFLYTYNVFKKKHTLCINECIQSVYVCFYVIRSARPSDRENFIHDATIYI